MCRATSGSDSNGIFSLGGAQCRQPHLYCTHHPHAGLQEPSQGTRPSVVCLCYLCCAACATCAVLPVLCCLMLLVQKIHEVVAVALAGAGCCCSHVLLAPPPHTPTHHPPNIVPTSRLAMLRGPLASAQPPFQLVWLMHCRGSLQGEPSPEQSSSTGSPPCTPSC